jgi:hypothetical protein
MTGERTAAPSDPQAGQPGTVGAPMCGYARTASSSSPKPEFAPRRPMAATPVTLVSAVPSEEVGNSYRADRPQAKATDNEAQMLVDADGVVIELTGAEALRAGFEQMFFDKHLSPARSRGCGNRTKPRGRRLSASSVKQRSARRMIIWRRFWKADPRNLPSRPRAEADGRIG